MFRCLGFALPVVFAVATSAAAQNACGTLTPIAGLLRGASTGLTVPFESFSFDSPNAANGSAAGSFTQNGVTVSTTSFYLGHNGQSPFIGFPFLTDALYNFRNFESVQIPDTLAFNTSMVGAAFNFALTTGHSAKIEAWKTGVFTPVATLVTSSAEVNPVNTTFGPSCWWGFQLSSGSFDRISITADAFGSIALDNLELAKLNTSTVPEPNAIALMALGLAGLGIVARRRVGRRKEE